MYLELLRLATKLASDNEGLPRWVSRNRAVSTAYYALFHALAERCARDLIGAWTPWPAFRHMYRSLDHGQARVVFDAVRKDPEFSDEAKAIAQVFLVLQEQRHGADYDLGHRVSDSVVSTLLSETERAIGLLTDLSQPERKLLAARLIGKARRIRPSMA